MARNDKPLIKRKAWATRTDAYLPPMKVRASEVYIHHTVGSIEGSNIDLDNDGLSDSFERLNRQIEDFHMDVRGWNAIAYNFMVGHKGQRSEGRGWGVQGGATGSPQDAYSVSISAHGNYEGVHKVTPQLIRAIVLTIADGIEAGHLVPVNQLTIKGHQEKPYATACPGSGLMRVVPSLKGRVERELKRRRRNRRIRAQIQKLRERIRTLQGKLS